ncbi:unnamed protein product [Rodentolepis nana]|uniref:Endoplasmic reticulum oxidoreductin-1 n=1 Tax=Rodentolepis nana TaxID=102285 RepID=A0A0R3TJG7_RODNA|nr:unnamed protein product [Rodentolepis nana]
MIGPGRVVLTAILLLSLYFISILSQPQCEITISGSIGDSNATVEEILDLNGVVLGKLEDIIKRDYFRIFKVNLYRKCNFWPDDGRCVLRDCQVQDCSISEVPVGIRESSYDKIIPAKAVRMGSDGESCSKEEEEEVTLGHLDTSIDEIQQKTIHKWSQQDTEDKPFCELGDDFDESSIYVDLLKNIEKYTGYKGESSQRVWGSIYWENCFKSAPPKVYDGIPYSPVDTATCKEKRLFYRMISGLQTSISLQLCFNHLLSDFRGAKTFFAQPTEHTWGPSVEEFARRFHPSLVPEALGRLRNLFLVYVVEMRAIAKIAPLLRQQAFYTGDTAVDAQTRSMVLDLLNDIEKHATVFNESQLFQASNQELLDLKEEFRLRFLNITRIMDCVGCDKCRMWGKLQIQGMGTALKILFSDGLFDVAEDGSVKLRPSAQLKRSEIVSLFNGFNKFAKSVDYYVKLRAMFIDQLK